MKTTVLALALAAAPMMFAQAPAKPADQPAATSTTKVKKAKKHHVKKAPKTTTPLAPAAK